MERAQLARRAAVITRSRAWWARSRWIRQRHNY